MSGMGGGKRTAGLGGDSPPGPVEKKGKKEEKTTTTLIEPIRIGGVSSTVSHIALFSICTVFRAQHWISTVLMFHCFSLDLLFINPACFCPPVFKMFSVPMSSSMFLLPLRFWELGDSKICTVWESPRTGVGHTAIYLEAPGRLLAQAFGQHCSLAPSRCPEFSWVLLWGRIKYGLKLLCKLWDTAVNPSMSQGLEVQATRNMEKLYKCFGPFGEWSKARSLWDQWEASVNALDVLQTST